MIRMRRGWYTPKCSLRVPLSLVGSRVPARRRALGRRTKAQPSLSVLLLLLLPPFGCSVLAAFLGLTAPPSGKGASFGGRLVRGCELAYLLEVWPSRSLEVGAFSPRLSECCWAPSPRPGSCSSCWSAPLTPLYLAVGTCRGTGPLVCSVLGDSSRAGQGCMWPELRLDVGPHRGPRVPT